MFNWRENVGGSIKIEREREKNILIGVKKVVGVLIEERKFSKKEMYHLILDELKRKNVSC